MSAIYTAGHSQPQTPALAKAGLGLGGFAVAAGLVVFGHASAAVAESVAAEKPHVNYIAALEPTLDGRRPKSSLRSRLLAARAARTIVEPAAAPVAARALSAAEETVDEDVPEPLAPEVHDPLEPVNRIVFGLNEVVDFVVLRPVSLVYRTVVPPPLRTGVSNALHNWASPVIFANDLLQGEPDRAKTTLVRFLVNSTAGFGGMVDAAATAGLPRHSEDFGQTLAVWGVGSGPYLVLPLLGPSNARDAVGLAADAATHPATWLMWDLPIWERATPVMAYTVSGHEALMDEADTLRRTSPDFYASVRDIYAQKRATEIANGSAEFDDLPPIPTD